MNCKGPCLQHCYNLNNIIYLLVGCIIGYILNSYLN